MGLFRDEVLARKTENLHGTISLAIPISWQLIAASLAAIIAVAIIFLLSANYSRTEIALGSVLPAGGILQVVPPRTGLVETVAVAEGQTVRRGQMLARIRAEEIDGSGAGTQTAILSAIARQRRSLERQEALTRMAEMSEQDALGEQIAGLQQELRSITPQIVAQLKLVDMAQEDLSQAKKIAARGFISRRDLAVRQEQLLSRQQQLSVLRQAETAKKSSIEQAIRSRRQAAATAAGLTSALTTSLAQIERENAAARGSQGYILTAPTDGQVAALNIHPGDAVNVQDAAMAIVPSQSRLVARLYVPVRAAGFARVGQSIRLAMDAYPFERFGTVDGYLTALSAAPVMRTQKNGDSAPFYVATASLKRPWISAYGRRQSLLPGMTFTARIVVERRTMLQWLFDPLIASTGR